jgi:hypothetical protein
VRTFLLARVFVSTNGGDQIHAHHPIDGGGMTKAGRKVSVGTSFRQTPIVGRGILSGYPSNSTKPRRLFSVLTILFGFKFVIPTYPGSSAFHPGTDES